MTPSGPWTLDEFERICTAALETGYRVRTVHEQLEAPAASDVAVMRHDVDRRPGNAVRMAERESALGIRSTYYVRMVPGAFDPEAVGAIHALGHEIGYHYEVLASARGDVARALALFGEELERLRALVPVTSAAAHGSPLSRHDSLDLWRHAAPGRFGLAGEAYLDLDYGALAYFTDTGRAWDADRTNLRDRPASAGPVAPRVHTGAELIELIRSRALPGLCLQTHPERWSSSLPGLALSAATDHAASTVKLMLAALGRRRRA